MPAQDGGVRAMWNLCVCVDVMLTAAGCDTVWRLDHVAEARGDGPNRLDCEGGTHDEDNDTLPDHCDLCPGIADDQTDSDSDGVGDACDPSATTQDQLALFISFADDSQTWRMLDGTWHGDGESLVYDSLGSTSYGIALFQSTMPDPPFTLEYHYAIDSLVTVTSGLQVLVDADATGKGVACGHVRREAPLHDAVRNLNAPALLSSETEIMAVTPGDYRVTATYDRTSQIQCALAADSMSTSGATTLTWSATEAPPAGALGFRSLQVAAHIHYVAIYTAK